MLDYKDLVKIIIYMVGSVAVLLTLSGIVFYTFLLLTRFVESVI